MVFELDLIVVIVGFYNLIKDAVKFYSKLYLNIILICISY